MRAWTYMLGGLILWAVHFFALYITASVFHTSDTTRVITVAITVLCLAGAGWLVWTAWHARAGDTDPFGAWTHYIAMLAGAIGCISILWQGLPALLI